MTRVFFNRVLCLIMGVLGCAAAHGTDINFARDSLRGVETIGVGVLIFEPQVESYVTENRLHTIMSLALRTAGLTVLEDDGGRDGNIVLTVSAVPMETQGEVTHFALLHTLSFTQAAQVMRTGEVGAYETWTRYRLGVAGTKRLREYSEASVRELIDEFLNDRLAAN